MGKYLNIWANDLISNSLKKNRPKSCCAHLQNRLALKSDWWWTCDVVPGLITGSSQSFWTSVVSVGGKEVHHSLACDSQTQTPPTVRCLEQSPLFQRFFTPGWFSPLLHCPSVPPPLPVFLTFLVQFPFLHPGVLTAAQMKTLGSSSSVSEVWGVESFRLAYRWASITGAFIQNIQTAQS